MAKNRINIAIGANLKKFSTDMQNVKREMRRTSRKMKSLGQSMTRSLTVPLGLMGGAMIKFASDTQESLNKVNVAFGDSSTTVKDFAKTTLKSFGIAESSALDMASTFGDMATSMGIGQGAAAQMSTKLVGLAGDLASFKNIRIDVAQTALNSIFTGETESLKKLGIVMTQANLSAFALEKGITKPIKAMTEGEKVMLRYNYVMEKTSNAHGDFERTGGGAANQMRVFQEGLKELAATFGEIILPMFTKIVSKANEIIQAFGNLSESTKKWILAIGGLVAAFGPLVYGLGAIINSLQKIGIGLGKTKDGFMILLKNPMALAAVAAVGLAVAIVNLGKKLDKNHPIVKRTKEVTNGLAEANENLKKQIKEVNSATSQGVEIDDVARQSMLAKTSQIINETIAKIENARATKMQLIEEKKLALQRALAATRGVGQQAEFIGVEQSKVTAIETSIESLNKELATTDKSLRDAFTSYLRLKEGVDPELSSKLVGLGNTTGGAKTEPTKTSIDDLIAIEPKDVSLLNEYVDGVDRFSLATKQIAPITVEVSTAWSRFTSDMRNVGQVIGGTFKVINAHSDEFKNNMINAAKALRDGILNLSMEAFEGFFVAIGQSITKQEDAFKNFGKQTLENVANFMSQFGKLLVAGAIASKAMQDLLFKHPVAAAAAGVALIAIAGTIKGMTSQNPTEFGGGQSSYIPPSTGGGSSYYGTSNDVMTLETVVYGRDIVLSSNRQHGTISRTRRK